MHILSMRASRILLVALGIVAKGLAAQTTGFVGIRPMDRNLNLGDFYATFEAEGESIMAHDKSMVGMDSVGRRSWVIAPIPGKPDEVSLTSTWIDETEPYGWAAKERLVRISQSDRWVSVTSVYSPGDYNNAGFRVQKNPRPMTFDSIYITELIILPPKDNIQMSRPGKWAKPKFYMCVRKRDYNNWLEDANDEGKANPAHFAWSGATLNLDNLQPDSYCEAVSVYVLAYPEPSDKKIKFVDIPHSAFQNVDVLTRYHNRISEE